MSNNYRLSSDVRHQYANVDGSIVEVELKAGDLSPATPSEEIAVAHLVAAGLAQEVADKAATRSKKSESADVTIEE